MRNRQSLGGTYRLFEDLISERGLYVHQMVGILPERATEFVFSGNWGQSFGPS